jgi:hypothetical protein
MDILAHGLWVGIAAAEWHRRRPLRRSTAALAVGMAVLPDLAQLLPLVVQALSMDEGWHVLLAYSQATPGSEPALSPRVAGLTHHLHCVMHSALVAGVVTGGLWLWLGRFWLPLCGWWSHVLIDVFTHSADFYPSPVFYPLTYWGFDGLAWNTPWFMFVNYLAMAVVSLIVLTRYCER